MCQEKKKVNIYRKAEEMKAMEPIKDIETALTDIDFGTDK
jgi:hypothetical protein